MVEIQFPANQAGVGGLIPGVGVCDAAEELDGVLADLDFDLQQGYVLCARSRPWQQPERGRARLEIVPRCQIEAPAEQPPEQETANPPFRAAICPGVSAEKSVGEKQLRVWAFVLSSWQTAKE